MAVQQFSTYTWKGSDFFSSLHKEMWQLYNINPGPTRIETEDSVERLEISLSQEIKLLSHALLPLVFNFKFKNQ